MDPAFASRGRTDPWLTQGKDKVLKIFSQHRAFLDLELVHNASISRQAMREPWDRFMQEIIAKGLVKAGTAKSLVQGMLHGQREKYKSKARRIRDMKAGVAWSPADLPIIQVCFPNVPSFIRGTMSTQVIRHLPPCWFQVSLCPVDLLTSCNLPLGGRREGQPLSLSLNSRTNMIAATARFVSQNPVNL